MKCKKCGKEMYLIEQGVGLWCDCRVKQPTDLDKLKATLDEIGIPYSLSQGRDLWFRLQIQWVTGNFPLIVFDKEGELIK